MKRLSSISILLIINILILMHTIVPHHHHGNIPCFSTDIFELCTTHDQQASEEKEHKHSDCCPHSHPCKDGSCAIENFVIFSNHGQKDGQECSVCLHLHPDHLLQAVLFIINYDLSAPENELFLRKPPYLTTYRVVYASQSLGLRAPPVLS